MSFSIKAQSRSLRLNLNYRSSGNGLGVIIVPQVSLCRNSNELSFGINFQQNRMNISGFQTNYNFVFYKGSIGLYAFYDIAYFKKCYLGKGIAKFETSVRPEFKSYYENLRLNVIDQHAGFGIRFYYSNYCFSYASISTGASCTMGTYDSSRFRSRDRYSGSLSLNVGISFKIFKRDEIVIPNKIGQSRL
jgi:hypothetical protein